MVHISRIEQNIAAFVDEDLVPKMPKLEGIALAAMAPIVVRSKLPSLLRMAQGTEILSGDNGDNVDVDLLYREYKRAAAGKWPVEMAGFKFYEDDLDKLYRYLQR